METRVLSWPVVFNIATIVTAGLTPVGTMVLLMMMAMIKLMVVAAVAVRR